MTRSRWLLLGFLATVGCNALDRILEGVPPPPPPPVGQISLVLLPSAITAPQGATHSLELRATRSGAFDGPVGFAFQNLPPGVTATLGEPVTVGAVTTVPAALVIGDQVPPGQYQFTVRGTADGLAPTSATINLTVAPKPTIALTVTPDLPTIARGGIAPVSITIARTNASEPVTLSLAGGPAGLTLVESDPVTGDTAVRHLRAAADLAPGSYPVRLAGATGGIATDDVSLVVAVTGAALQVIAPATIEVAQGAMGTTNFILNRTVSAGAVALSIDGTPAGISAAFTVTGEHQARLVLTAAAASAPGSYPVTLRAQSAGVPDAVASVTLVIVPAHIAVTLLPPSLTLPPGGTGAAQVRIDRTNYAGSVRLEVDALPGLTITPAPAVLIGDNATLSVVVADDAPPGLRTITVRAIPEELQAEAVVTANLALTITAPMPVIMVRLDWSACAAPVWVAAQDGESPWEQVTPAAGVFTFPMRAEQVGIAFATATATEVRYLDRNDVGSGLMPMCPPFAGTTTSMSGMAEHGNIIEPTWFYNLGGGTATSTPDTPAFTITGVAPGVHDLVVSGFSARTLSRRVLLRRDVPVVPFGTLALVDISHPDESFTPIQATLQISLAGQEPGGTLARPMSYLTTAACTVNPLWDVGLFLGVPAAWQRPSDFHMQTVRWTGPTTVVEATEVFHAFASRTISFPPIIQASISTLPGPYRRLHTQVTGLPAVFNERVTLSYSGPGGRTLVVSAAAGQVRAAGGLSMPDLSGVAGWMESYGLPASASGTWWTTAEGRDGASLCVEGRRLVSSQRRGSY